MADASLNKRKIGRNNRAKELFAEFLDLHCPSCRVCCCRYRLYLQRTELCCCRRYVFLSQPAPKRSRRYCRDTPHIRCSPCLY